ncbi:MAG TPA: hypothetical protein VJT31_09230 [Rugosimonospora sp.]|nr:hypothetical protein [Rugosimonospora sp.]
MSQSVPVSARRGQRWRVRAALVCAALVVSLVALDASVPVAPARAASTFVLLQMNLCNSGMAHSCYSFGRAVDEAAGKIRARPPDMVSLQEVCSGDFYSGAGWGKLGQAMADLYGSENVAVDFMPAFNRDRKDYYHCLNGTMFGVALVHRGNGREFHYGWYRAQDPSDEMRTWTCGTLVKDRLTGCTTHLSTDPAVAIRQCHELIAILASPWVLPEVIVAGDFNLTSQPGKPYDAQGCTPPGYERRSDNSLQQVFYTANIQWISGGTERMDYTDHPLLYETFHI